MSVFVIFPRPGSRVHHGQGRCAAADFRPAAARQAAAVYDRATSPVVLRNRAQVTEFFDGWDLVEPGLVQVPLWRPDAKPPRPRELDRIWVYGGVARKST